MGLMATRRMATATVVFIRPDGRTRSLFGAGLSPLGGKGGGKLLSERRKRALRRKGA